ncbi:MAG: hypothetical protein H6Q90_1436 [Deltaproteobacteria bacterium]|nr:hypothetical protein [Deltaproteobacteria bacterium]
MSRRTAPRAQPWIIALALVAAVVCASSGTAEARHRASLRACEGGTPCPPEVAKLYEQEPTIELVTMGIGELAWERHGHIALCVRYHDPAKDVCYNYGIGDFHHPVQMAWGFFRGAKSFWAGEQQVQELLEIYVGRDRTVWAQPIPLTAEQKQQVIEKLQFDILDEHRYYAYDHFWDNCTTRVRDILDNATGGALKSITDETDGKTFRELARDGFYGLRLFLLVTDLAMGRVTDRVPTYWERMFLPQYLREGVARRWGIQPILLYERHGPIASDKQDANGNGIADIHEDANGNGIPDLEEDADHNSGRVLFALFILLVTSPVLLTRWLGRFERIGLAIAIVPPVILGLVLWLLAIISPLPYIEWNESCLVFLPLDLALLVLGPDKRRVYARGRVAMLGLCAALHLVGVLTQPLVAALLWPLIPVAVVGFWKPAWSRKRDEPAAPSAGSSKPATASAGKAGSRFASSPTNKPKRR